MSKLVDLFERATGESKREPDFALNLEIADRLNQSRRACAEGIEYFKQLLSSSDLRTVNLAMNLLDTCVKNCGMHFHRYANNRGLVPSLVGILKRRRKKLNVLDKLAGLYKDKGWRKIEDQVLGLVQLWADTFMMQEDKYPAFLSHYRDLRKEGLKFPPREANERFMIRFEGEASPAFELAELEAQLRGANPQESRLPAAVRRPIPSVRRPVDQAQAEEVPKLTSADISTIKNSLPLLEQLIGNASSYRELQEGHVRDVYRTCRDLQKKLIVVVSYEAGEVAGESDTVDLLSILDYVNQRLQNIRQAIDLIKRQGGGSHIKSMLQQQSPEQPVDLLDLGDDFLSMPESNPLDKLDKFEAGRREERKEPVQTVSSPAVPTPAVTVSSGGVTMVEPPRQEPAFIDLLDWDTPQVSVPQPAAEEEDFFASLASRKVGT
jgi:hypothetical protein